MMPRPKGKSRRIAFNLLGVPANMRNYSRSENKRRRNRKLIEQEIASRYTRR